MNASLRKTCKGLKPRVIHADPPWAFATRGNGDQVPTQGEQPYPTLRLEDLKALDVDEIAHQNCVLVMWYIGSHLKQAIELGESWGFTYKTDGFTWRKLTKDGTATRIGMGYYVRKETEKTLIFTRGKGVERIGKGVRELIDAPVREHSRKPEEIFSRLEEMFGKVPRLDLFGRTPRPGWKVWGNEAARFDRNEEDLL